MGKKAWLAIMTCWLLICPAAASGQLWSDSQLTGQPGERQGGRLTAPDLSAPARTVPQHVSPPLAQGFRGSIRRVDTAGEKLVALTFDLCELADKTAGYDYEIVDYLRREKVAATFFAGGKWMRSHPERTMQLMSDPLFEVGSHAWTHGNFGVLSPDKMREQVLWTQAQYEVLREQLAVKAQSAGMGRMMAQAPLSVTVFRFPYGRCRPEGLDLLAGLGIVAVQWDVNTVDPWRGQSAQAIAKVVESRVRPGSIVIGHANGFGWHEAEALRLYIPMLKAKGYRFVTVSQLLASGKPVAAQDCYDAKPGDTAAYDRQFGDGTVHPGNR